MILCLLCNSNVMSIRSSHVRVSTLLIYTIQAIFMPSFWELNNLIKDLGFEGRVRLLKPKILITFFLHPSSSHFSLPLSLSLSLLLSLLPSLLPSLCLCLYSYHLYLYLFLSPLPSFLEKTVIFPYLIYFCSLTSPFIQVFSYALRNLANIFFPLKYCNCPMEVLLNKIFFSSLPGNNF